MECLEKCFVIGAAQKGVERVEKNKELLIDVFIYLIFEIYMIIESFIIILFACAAFVFLSHYLFFSWYKNKRNVESITFLRSKNIIN